MNRPLAAGTLALALAGLSCACVLALTHGRTASARPTPAAARLMPHRRYIGVYTPGDPGGPGVARFERATGTRPTLIAYFTPFGARFDPGAAASVVRDGALPLIQINPRTVSVSSIADGQWNTYLARYAAAVKRFGSPVAVSFGHEMNGNWYTWGRQHTPAPVFVRAWRVIHHAFARAGATNVTWVWTVNRSGGPAANPAAWWPGAAYVNWVGIDGRYISPSGTFASVFGPTIRQIRAFTLDRILISEAGVRPGPRQPAQITNLLDSAARLPGIAGVVWFDATARYDWRLDHDPRGAAAFRRAARAYA